MIHSEKCHWFAIEKKLKSANKAILTLSILDTGKQVLWQKQSPGTELHRNFEWQPLKIQNMDNSKLIVSIYKYGIIHQKKGLIEILISEQ